MSYALLDGDCLEHLKSLPDDSIDAIVTDPPYGLKFMGKKWDYEIPSVEVWRECLRVLKPGGHALIACGTRTQHRMAVNIEDAGFEIRDVITWLYGSGFPKSLNIGKQGGPEGWGTALKPACEFWTLARKPLGESTVAKNVLKHGTGGINVDGCRVETTDALSFGSRELGDGIKYGKCEPTTPGIQNPQGRFPANLILDEEAAAMLDEQTGNLGKSSGGRSVKRSGKYVEGRVSAPGEWTNEDPGFGDSGGASRFFYTAKASKSERGAGNSHPTVKPLKLMRYLCRLITPPGGLVLDPFMGSGSTGVAAVQEGFIFLGIEREPDYMEIATKRLEAA